jgi:hypothetical protein
MSRPSRSTPRTIFTGLAGVPWRSRRVEEVLDRAAQPGGSPAHVGARGAITTSIFSPSECSCVTPIAHQIGQIEAPACSTPRASNARQREDIAEHASMRLGGFPECGRRSAFASSFFLSAYAVGEHLRRSRGSRRPGFFRSLRRSAANVLDERSPGLRAGGASSRYRAARASAPRVPWRRRGRSAALGPSSSTATASCVSPSSRCAPRNRAPDQRGRERRREWPSTARFATSTAGPDVGQDLRILNVGCTNAHRAHDLARAQAIRGRSSTTLAGPRTAAVRPSPRNPVTAPAPGRPGARELSSRNLAPLPGTR